MGGRVAYEGRCVGWTVLLLRGGADELKASAEDQSDLRMQKGLIYEGGGAARATALIAHSSGACTPSVCTKGMKGARRVICWVYTSAEGRTGTNDVIF